ncbi:MAG: hypothetical protein GKS07_01190 [Nitrosopumilus sp.]|nr:MAG: hypothetical protein GKS07_01190 [Nitrosopumilus sp.]
MMTKNKGKPVENLKDIAFPKCKSHSLTIHGNNTGYTITDIHSKYFEVFRCNACGFECSTDYNNQGE